VVSVNDCCAVLNSLGRNFVANKNSIHHVPIFYSFVVDQRRKIESSELNAPLARFCHVGVVQNDGKVSVSVSLYQLAASMCVVSNNI